MRIVATGGAGYVGSACVRHLSAVGREVLVYDDLSQGHRESIAGMAELVVGDVLDTEKLRGVLQSFGAQAVMHFAGLTSVPESIVSPERYHRTNVEGTHSLLEAMRGTGVARLLFSSTCAVYEQLGPGEGTLSESAPCNPQSPYARTKLAAERAIEEAASADGFGYTVLRYFNAAGADEDGQHGEDHRPETHLIPIALQAATGQRPSLDVYGSDFETQDGSAVRDYVHIADLARAHAAALEATDERSREIFNVGTGQGRSVLEVVAACERVTGRPIERRTAPTREGDAARLVADAARIRAKLNWEPLHAALEDIVETAWRWQTNHPRGYSD